MTKKVAVLVSKIIHGGAQLNAIETANALSETNEVTVYQLFENGDAVYRLSSSVEIRKVERNWTSLIKFLIEVRTNYDTLFIFTPYFCLLAFLVTRQTKVIYRVINRIDKGKICNLSLKERLLDLTLFLTKKHISHFVAQCESMQLEIETKWKVDKSKITTIYNPFKIIGAIEKYSKSNRQYKFIFIGKLSHQKNIPFLADAIRRYYDLGGKGRILVIGRGKLQDKIEQLVDDYGVEHKEYCDDTLEYIADSENILLCSLYEGFPNVLVEAMHMGTFIISLNTKHGVSEIVENQEIGMIIPEKIESFANAMLKRETCKNANFHTSVSTGQFKKYSKDEFGKCVRSLIDKCS